MLRNLEWEPLEHRRAAQRLTLIYKSVNILLAINTDSYQTKSREGVSNRSHTASAFPKKSADKDCYKFLIYPRTLAEWNCLPPELRDAPTLAIFKAGIRSINLGDVINKAHYQNLSCCSVTTRRHVTSLRGDYALYHQNQNQNQ